MVVAMVVDDTNVNATRKKKVNASETVRWGFLWFLLQFR